LECLHFTNKMKAVDEIQKFSLSETRLDGGGEGENEGDREGERET